MTRANVLDAMRALPNGDNRDGGAPGQIQQEHGGGLGGAPAAQALLGHDPVSLLHAAFGLGAPQGWRRDR